MCSQSEVSSDLDPIHSGLNPDKAVNIKLSQWIYPRVNALFFLLAYITLRAVKDKLK